MKKITWQLINLLRVTSDKLQMMGDIVTCHS